MLESSPPASAEGSSEGPSVTFSSSQSRGLSLEDRDSSARSATASAAPAAAAVASAHIRKPRSATALSAARASPNFPVAGVPHPVVVLRSPPALSLMRLAALALAPKLALPRPPAIQLPASSLFHSDDGPRSVDSSSQWCNADCATCANNSARSTVNAPMPDPDPAASSSPRRLDSNSTTAMIPVWHLAWMNGSNSARRPRRATRAPGSPPPPSASASFRAAAMTAAIVPARSIARRTAAGAGAV
mmetsp:Transcript_24389/g.60672  ORF Transcript_24389/g.60672 Transcript_24389/m.60672 type:complete len:245 (+) Transcript_24389:402-1136(+)